jgi:serine/threonine-protein kinase
MNMRQLTPALVLTSACILAACGSHGAKPAATGGGAPTTSPSAAPVAVKDLPRLLLSEAETNAALGATGVAVIPSGPEDQMADTSSDIPNKDCVVLRSNAESTVYTGTGYVAVYEKVLQDDPDIQKAKFRLDEAVVSFPSATDAAKFFTASSQRWPACANQTFKDLGGSRTDTWTAGPVSNKNGMLSNTTTQEGVGGWACQRALTVANNVAVDVDACSFNPDDSAVTVANKIAAKVAKL